MGTMFTIWLYLSILLISIFRMGILVDILLLMALIYLIRGRNLEYEYAVTNGDLDIDMIIAKRKRKRLFSANCKDFEILARVSHEKFNEAKNIANKIIAVSSKDSQDIYFLTMHYKEARTLVLFEPDERMLKAFKTYIPKKVFD